MVVLGKGTSRNSKRQRHLSQRSANDSTNKYGDPAKLTDKIINTIQNTRPSIEGENKGFIELVNAVEDGYKDLKRLELEKGITTTSPVNITERKLPASIKREWAKLVSADNSVVDKTDKFPSLLKFLPSQKRAIYMIPQSYELLLPEQ